MNPFGWALHGIVRTAHQAVPRLAFDRVRSYELVRTAHLERARDFAPASILYGGRRYDFDDELADPLDLHRCGPLGLVAILWTNRVAALEINEPLQLSGLPRAALAVAAVRLADRARRRHTRIGSYAIENLDPFALRPARRRSRLRRSGEALLSRQISRRLDRIAYGTEGARRLYEQRLGDALTAAEAEPFPAVPAPCGCPAGETEPELVLYVGALHRRKGVLQLLDAWPHVLTARPGAHLVIVGKGELEDEARSRAAELNLVKRGSVELILDPPRPEIHRLLRRAATLVLLSQPTARWREQVGLPIVEGLGHDCRVVASSQTGLADWLSDHGHPVLEPEAGPEELGRAVAATLEDRWEAGSVLAQLPETDGRRAADDWLMQTPDPRSAQADSTRADSTLADSTLADSTLADSTRADSTLADSVDAG